MLSSVNPYGIGNAFAPQGSQNIQKPQEQSITQSQQSQELQELPTLSQRDLEIRRFSNDIKGANEMVGAMQIADITLNALSNQAKLGTSSTQELDNTAKAAQFKGESLFGRELSMSLAGENISLSLPLPSQIEGDLVENFSNKHDEISKNLSKMSELIEKASMPIAPNSQNYDFENFDATAFKNMFS